MLQKKLAEVGVELDPDTMRLACTVVGVMSDDACLLAEGLEIGVLSEDKLEHGPEAALVRVAIDAVVNDDDDRLALALRMEPERVRRARTRLADAIAVWNERRGGPLLVPWGQA